MAWLKLFVEMFTAKPKKEHEIIPGVSRPSYILLATIEELIDNGQGECTVTKQRRFSSSNRIECKHVWTYKNIRVCYSYKKWDHRYLDETEIHEKHLYISSNGKTLDKNLKKEEISITDRIKQKLVAFESQKQEFEFQKECLNALEGLFKDENCPSKRPTPRVSQETTQFESYQHRYLGSGGGHSDGKKSLYELVEQPFTTV